MTKLHFDDLTKITCPLGLPDDDTQERLKAATDDAKEVEDYVAELEAKLAKAVEGIRTARGFYQVTHIHAALDATLAELTGESDE